MILKTLRYELADGIATITFDEQGSPVNTMCLQWQADLAQAAMASRQRVNQQLRHFQAQGLIRLGYRNIVLLRKPPAR